MGSFCRCQLRPRQTHAARPKPGVPKQPGVPFVGAAPVGMALTLATQMMLYTVLGDWLGCVPKAMRVKDKPVPLKAT